MPREQDDTSWVFTRIINANDIKAKQIIKNQRKIDFYIGL